MRHRQSPVLRVVPPPRSAKAAAAQRSRRLPRNLSEASRAPSRSGRRKRAKILPRSRTVGKKNLTVSPKKLIKASNRSRKRQVRSASSLRWLLLTSSRCQHRSRSQQVSRIRPRPSSLRSLLPLSSTAPQRVPHSSRLTRKMEQLRLTTAITNRSEPGKNRPPKSCYRSESGCCSVFKLPIVVYRL